MTDPDELGRAVAPIADALDAIGVRWAIGGSIASAVHGEPRATNDVDVVAALDETQARDLCARLGATFHADADTAVDAVRRRSSFNVIDTRSFIKIDIFVHVPGYRRQRRRPCRASGEGARRREVTVTSGASR